jgi:hypothetical protein
LCRACRQNSGARFFFKGYDVTGYFKVWLVVLATLAAAGSALGADLVKTDTVVGKGKEAVAGKTVEVHYTGWLHDASAKNKRGKQFDSSVGRGPFSFPLGAGRVMKASPA